MESIANIERDCNAISNLFQVIVNDMKGSSGNWEELVVKGTKFHTQLKATITASTAFLDTFQRIADLATSTRGGTKEIGSALTRLCLRHRSVEAKLKTFTSSLMDCLILPLSDRLEEWKKTTSMLDKDHSKEMKRLKAELKKGHHLLSSSSTLKNKRRMKGHRSSGASFAGGSRSGSISGGSITGSMSTSMSSGMESVEGSEKLFLLEEMEKRSLRRALIEERSRFCLFVNFLRPVIEEELSMINEIHYLEEIMDNLALLTTDPYILPPSSELVISDHLKLISGNSSGGGNGSDNIYANYKSWSQMNVNEGANSPPGSGFGSRKNSMCSISSFASNSNSDGRSDSPSSVIYASTGGHRRSQTRGASAPRCHSLSARGFEEDDDRDIHARQGGHHRDSYAGGGHQYRHQHASATNGTVIPIGVPTVPAPTPSLPSSNKTSPQEVISGQNSINYTRTSARNSYSTNSSPTIHFKQIPTDFRQVGNAPSNLTRSSISVMDSSNMYDRGQNPYIDPRTVTTAFANSGSGDWTSSSSVGGINDGSAYSEGSITPTNPERSVSPVSGGGPTSSGYSYHQQQQHQQYKVNPDGQYNSSNEYNSSRQESQRLISSSSSSSVSSASQGTTVGHQHHPSSGGQIYGQSGGGQNRGVQPVIAPSLPARNANHDQQQIYSSGATLRREKPPPLPPVRRTSAISDPNAITLGTLRSTGCSTYEEVKRKSTLNLSNYEDPIYCNLNIESKNRSESNNNNNNDRSSTCSSTSLSQEQQQQQSVTGRGTVQTSTPSAGGGGGRVGTYPTDHDRISAILQKHHRPSSSTQPLTSSSVTNCGISTMASILGNPESRSSSDSLPPPPSSSITGSSTAHGPPGHGSGSGRLTNTVHKDFLQSLNDKLSIPVSQRMSPKLTKRRSMSVGEHEWDSDSGIVTLERDRDSVGDRSNPNSATSSISSNSNPLQQSLMRLMSSSMSTTSSTNSSGSRPSSASSFSQRALTSMSSSMGTGETYTAFTLTSAGGNNCVPTSSAAVGHPSMAPNHNSNLSSVNPHLLNNVSNNNPSTGRMSMSGFDPTMEIAKAAADVAKRRMNSSNSEGGGHSCNTSTSMTGSTTTSASVVVPSASLVTGSGNQSIAGQQDTYYSATPARVEYSPTHQPTSSIINSTSSQVNEKQGTYRPLPDPPPNKERSVQRQSNVSNIQQQQQQPSQQQNKGGSIVVINAGSRQQQFAATHHPSLDIKVPSDASIHSNYGQSVHPTTNGSIVSMKRGSLPAVMMHRSSPGQVFSEAIGSFENAITSRVNNWLSTASGLSSRSGSVELTTNLAANLSNCKETLMDQIKKGIPLKKVPSPDQSGH